MRSLRWIGVVSTLLFVGVLGGLVLGRTDGFAALQDPAPPMPTLTIDGVQITNLIYYGDGCGTGATPAAREAAKFDTSYNTCWSIPAADNTALPIHVLTKDIINETLRLAGRTVGNWSIASYAATNKARVIIYDVSTAGATDAMKLTGITFTPLTAGTAANPMILPVLLTNTFNQPDGVGPPAVRPARNYLWQPGLGGTLDPFPNAAVPGGDPGNGVGSGMTLIGTGNIGDGHAGNVANLVAAVHNNFGGPAAPANTVGSFSENPTSATIKETNGTTASLCKTSSVFRLVNNVQTEFFFCAPTITYTYTITVVGLDILNLTDSVIGCGGGCDDTYGGGVMCDEYGGNCQSTCTDIAPQCEDTNGGGFIGEDKTANKISADAAGASAMCGANCIINMVQAKPVNRGALKTFVFKADGPGLCLSGPCPTTFEIKTNEAGIGGKTFDNLNPNEIGLRKFRLPASTLPNRWELEKITCQSSLNNGTTTFETRITRDEDRGRVRVLKLGAGDTLTCVWTLRKDD